MTKFRFFIQQIEDEKAKTKQSQVKPFYAFFGLVTIGFAYYSFHGEIFNPIYFIVSAVIAGLMVKYWPTSETYTVGNSMDNVPVLDAHLLAINKSDEFTDEVKNAVAQGIKEHGTITYGYLFSIDDYINAVSRNGAAGLLDRLK